MQLSKIICLLTVASTGLLSACGGGSSSTSTSSAPTLSGTAAVGSPIVGAAVKIVCAGGSNLAASTDSLGAWSKAISGQTLPCAVEVTSGKVNGVDNVVAYHSLALSAGTVNVTPLSELLVANLALGDPKTWFDGLNNSTAASTLGAIKATAVDAALAQVRAALPALTALATSNPITQVFTAASGNALDDMLTALALASTTVSYNTLLTAAASPTFTPPPALAAALDQAYKGTKTGSGSTSTGGSTTGSVGCTGDVATFFAANAKTATAKVTTYNATPNATPTVLGKFANGSTTQVTINANCTISVGGYTLAVVDKTFFFGNGQYDVDMAAAGLSFGHFEKFSAGDSLLGFTDPVNKDSAQFSIP